MVAGARVGAVVFLAMAINRLLLPATTGWSLGRSVFGIRVVRRDGSPAGPWLLLLRDLAHLLDTAALFIGWFWPLWDSRRRTLPICSSEPRCAASRVIGRIAAGSPVPRWAPPRWLPWRPPPWATCSSTATT